MESGFDIRLPGWVAGFLADWPEPVGNADEAMALAVALSAENVRQGSGGPFGAVVADLKNASVVAVGVNLVTAVGLSSAHAEIVALSLAQRSEGNWHLGHQRHLTLATSCEPCAMCFGAVPWSGVTELICGARKEDAESAGFDEGDKPDDWAGALMLRGIEVQTDVLREQAAAVFDLYRANGGEIYNAT